MSISVLRTVRKIIPLAVRMQSTYTESPGWIKKMKDRFAALDVDKNGVIDQEDVKYLASKLAAYRNRGEDATKRYFTTFNAVFGVQGSINVDEFVSGMKEFVKKPDAEERAHGIADTVFEIIDEDGNGVVSYEEYYRFHKASSNMSEDMIKHFFATVDKNGDGVLQRSEFRESTVKLLMSEESY